MLWVAPLLVFAIAQFLSYTGNPEISLFDRTLAASKLAGATLGIELIGVNVANATMHSYGQKTISHPAVENLASDVVKTVRMDTEPAEEDLQPVMGTVSVDSPQDPQFTALDDPIPYDETPIPTVEPSEASASSDSKSDSSAGQAFSLFDMIYGNFLYLVTLRPQVAWFTIYPQFLTGLIFCMLVRLAIKITGFYKDVGQAWYTTYDQLHQLTQGISESCGLANRAKETLEFMEKDRFHHRKQTWKYMDELRLQIADIQEGRKNDHQDLVTAMARLESLTHVIEERSRKLNTDWSTSLTIDGCKKHLIDGFTTLKHWQVEFENQKAINPNKFAKNLVHDMNYILVSIERAIEAAQKVLMKEESFATYAQPQDLSTDQDLPPLRGPPLFDRDTTSPRTLTSLEMPDPTNQELEEESLRYQQEELIWKEKQEMANEKKEREKFEPLRTKIEREEREREEREREEREREEREREEREQEREQEERRQKEKVHENFEPLRTKIEREEREQEERARKENKQKENERKEVERKEVERKEIERKEIERKEIERKEIEPANQPAETKSKKEAKAKKGTKSKKGPGSKDPEPKESESKNP